MKISESTSVSMPIKNMLAIVAGVIAGVIGYTELTGRLTSLETSRELMLNDLLKASDQKPIDQEQFLIQESLASDLEKTVTRVDEMMHNGISGVTNDNVTPILWATDDPPSPWPP